MALSYNRSKPPFKGFPAGRVRFTRVPAPFFTDLLPQIDHLGELKVTLYALWFLDQLEGTFRYLCEEDFLGDERLMLGMDAGPEGMGPEDMLAESLRRAVERGSLLAAEVEGEEENTVERYYFLNTPKGQAAVRGITRGDWRPSGDHRQPIALDLERPNIFKLYEEHIGPITPMIADILKDAERSYPPDWIEDAIRIAVENNVRRWRYVQAILNSWHEEGRDDQNRGYAEKDRRKYVEGPFADFIEH